ncbi:MAG: winged helix-turn-helix transcriptional regulator [Candidatus Thermoplasmatota archaeon]|nr:winged helix-turn-helix transcriptional regulator [Candidatus Thermoplasmatota archaeon]
MAKVTLNRNAFKALASDTRLEIIRTLDGQKMSLTELSKKTSLNKATLHEHLNKLTEAGLVKRIQREGHKWVYYKLSWKGESLLHPENTKIVVVFAAAFTALIAGFIQMYLYITSKVVPESAQEFGVLNTPSSDTVETTTQSAADTGIIPADIWLYASIICFLVFVVLLVFSIHKLWIHKHPSL